MSIDPTTRPSQSAIWSQIQAISSLTTPSYCLIVQDAETALQKIPSGCVNTCLTSPPYWSARDYEHEEQIGLEECIEEYINKIVAVFAQVRRVLVEDGTAWLNLGDCYLHSYS